MKIKEQKASFLGRGRWAKHGEMEELKFSWISFRPPFLLAHQPLLPTASFF